MNAPKPQGADVDNTQRVTTEGCFQCKYATSVSNGLLSALEVCLVIWSCPNHYLFDIYLFGRLSGTLVVTEMKVSLVASVSSHPKVLVTLRGPVESLSLAFIITKL